MGSGRGWDEILFVSVGIVVCASVPESYDAPAGHVTKVLDSAFGSDESVVPPGVGGVVALLIGCEDAVVEFHEHHAEVFDVEYGVHAGLGKGWPYSGVELDWWGVVGGVSVGDFVVERECALRDDSLCVASCEPVHYVDVVCGLLEE